MHEIPRFGLLVIVAALFLFLVAVLIQLGLLFVAYPLAAVGLLAVLGIFAMAQWGDERIAERRAAREWEAGAKEREAERVRQVQAELRRPYIS